MVNRYSPEQAWCALLAIPANIDHDTRAKVGMAAKDAGVSFDDYDSWQAANPRYDAAEVRSMWRSFTDGPVKAGTLFSIAKEHGWTATGNTSRPAPERATRAAEPPRKPAPGMSAAEVYARCEPATNEHGYIVAKHAAGVPLDALRVVPAGDKLTIAGQSMAGALVVPAYAPDGTFQSLQFIPAPGAGKKLNLPGASMAGASFTVGAPGAGGLAYVCEGIGAAWACWQATGAAAVVAFGWGNVRKVAGALRQHDKSARLVLVPDVGKESDADTIAAEIQCAVAKMPEGWPENSDVNDYAQSAGHDALQLLLEAATAPPGPEPLLKPVSVFDVVTHPSPAPAFVWDGYLPRGNVSLLSAHGGTGKSTLALMLAICAALGRPLFGVDTEACKVLFVGLEDSASVVRHRLAHTCRTWGIDPEQLRDCLHIVDGTEHPELFAAETRGAGETTLSYHELRRLVQSEHIGLVLVDNASDAFGGDEIQRRQVRAFMRALALVARSTDCAVMLLAHVDKMTSRARKAEGGEGYSGSTAWHNSARSRLFLSRAEDGLLTLEHQKSNLGKLREPLTLSWPDGGLPMLDSEAPDVTGLTARMQGRADDDRAKSLLKLIAEFEGRGQFCSPIATARNNVHAMLRSEPEFQKLKLGMDATKRILNQCHRAAWIESVDYRTPDRKYRQCWTLTAAGRGFAGLGAPCAPSAPSCHEGAQSARGAPSAPSLEGGTGGKRAHNLINSGDLIPEAKRRGRPRKSSEVGPNE